MGFQVTTPLSERWGLFRSKGGKQATAFWMLRQALRLDVFKLLSVDLAQCTPAPPVQGVSLLQIRSHDDLNGCDPLLVTQLDRSCGSGVFGVVRRGGRVYALTGADGVLCQLNIDTHCSRIDTPCQLKVSLTQGACFLSFLYSSPSARRQGWARHLLAQVLIELARDGFRMCLCHVQATNLRSLNTFSKAGWRTTGWLVATASGHYLALRLRRVVGVAIKEDKQSTADGGS